MDANTFWNVVDTIWIIEGAIVVVGVGYGIFLWVRGISPALLRLGNGLARRKIAIFAQSDNFSSIKSLLMDSRLFKGKNICSITKKEDIGRAEDATMYLVFWPDWSNDIEDILSQKPDKCALIVYAPYDRGRIPDEQMKRLDGKRHTAVTNFRGRLLNDIVASMITTRYEQS
jgi:hypothetical protein